MRKPFQLFDENGDSLVGISASYDEVFEKGLLHGAAHIWVWRKTATGKEVLIQRRAAHKVTYPNVLDISAAGHIDLGETPRESAQRELFEELGLNVEPDSMREIFIHRFRGEVAPGAIENEWKWVYLYELTHEQEFALQTSEVAEVHWIELEQLTIEQQSEPDAGKYVYQGPDYFSKLIQALEAA